MSIGCPTTSIFWSTHGWLIGGSTENTGATPGKPGGSVTVTVKLILVRDKNIDTWYMLLGWSSITFAGKNENKLATCC